MGACNCSMFCCTLVYVNSSFDGEERAGYFAKFVFLMSLDGCVALPRGAVGLPAICNCGISSSYSLTNFTLLSKLNIKINETPKT